MAEAIYQSNADKTKPSVCSVITIINHNAIVVPEQLVPEQLNHDLRWLSKEDISVDDEEFMQCIVAVPLKDTETHFYGALAYRQNQH